MNELPIIYEIPMTLSDQGLSSDNYREKVAQWLDVIQRNAANCAPSVLLIHPNRTFKILTEAQLLDRLSPEVLMLDMDAFGDFWRKRDQFTFHTRLTDGGLVITIPEKDLTVDEKLGIFVKDGKNLSHLVVEGEDKQSLSFSAADWDESSLILYAIGKPHRSLPWLMLLLEE